MEYSLLRNVTQESHRWRVRVGVTRTNEYIDDGPEKRILRINFVLLDEEGGTMEGQIPKHHIAQFKGKLHDNHVYYIEYFEVTEAKKTYQAVRLPIMARFTRYTTIREITPVPDSFPQYAYTLASFQVLRSRIGDKTFLSGKLSLQGSTNCQWYTDPAIPEIVALKNSFAGVPHEISWIGQKPMTSASEKTIVAALSKLNAHDVVGLTCIVDVSIKNVVPHKNWWYMSCASCKRTAEQVDNEYICQRCPNMTAEPRYKLALLAADPSDISKEDAPIAEFVLFGTMVERLIGAPVFALTTLAPNMHDIVPPQITRLYNRQYNFRVSGSRGALQRLEPSFHVDSIAPLAMPLLLKTPDETATQSASSSMLAIQGPNIHPSTNVSTPIQAGDQTAHASPPKHVCFHSDEPTQETPTDVEQPETASLVPAKCSMLEDSVLAPDSRAAKRPSTMKKLQMDEEAKKAFPRDKP